MSVIKISELTAGTPLDTDIIPYVDLVTGITKKALKSELKGADGTNGTDGADGTDGVDAYVYIAYASDASGTGFTMTFDADLNYIAVKNSTTPITSPSASDFTGLWKNYKGATGPAGADGTDGVDGIMASIVAGTGISVDSTDQANPVVSSTITQATRDSLGLDTDDSPQFNGINIGHASDTTLTRVSAGVVAVEGVTVPTISSTSTLTNKRITPRVTSETSSATPTINTDNSDIHRITALAVDITSMTTNLSGTPTHGQKLIIEITGTAARAITWGTSFEASTVALPTTTVTTAMLSVGFVYNSATSKWRCLASA